MKKQQSDDFRDVFCATSSQSDKISRHGYQRFYPWFLQHLVGKSPVILEIGYYEGESVKLWKDYFLNPEIHVCDIKQPDSPAGEFIFHELDQSSEIDWARFRAEQKLEFDFIIDDGSHIPDHQMVTLNSLWPSLKEGGVYVLEDVETSYFGKSSLYGYTFDSRKSSIFKGLLGVIDIINRKISSTPSAFSVLRKNTKELKFYFADETEMITFGYNCIILVKKHRKYTTYYEQPYNLQQMFNNMSVKSRITRRLKVSRH